MADISYAQSKVDGVVLTGVNATAGPDRVRPDERGVVIVHNSNAGAVVVTATDPGTTKYGKANPDLPSVSIPAGGHASLGPFPADLMDPSDGYVDLTAAPFASVVFYGVKA
jgi:hypothetical protein